MNDEAYQKLIKDALSKIKDSTLNDLAQNDLGYLRSADEHENAEREYLDMRKTLTTTQKEIIDRYVTAIEKNDTDAQDLAYIAGLYDMIKFMKLYGKLK